MASEPLSTAPIDELVGNWKTFDDSLPGWQKSEKIHIHLTKDCFADSYRSFEVMTEMGIPSPESSVCIELPAKYGSRGWSPSEIANCTISRLNSFAGSLTLYGTPASFAFIEAPLIERGRAPKWKSLTFVCSPEPILGEPGDSHLHQAGESQLLSETSILKINGPLEKRIGSLRGWIEMGSPKDMTFVNPGGLTDNESHLHGRARKMLSSTSREHLRTEGNIEIYKTATGELRVLVLSRDSEDVPGAVCLHYKCDNSTSALEE